MLGPAGVSHSRDPKSPEQTASTPKIHANIAICSGLIERDRAEAAGIISNAVINKIPTIFMEIAITIAIRIMNIKLARSGFNPSAVATSTLTVAAKSSCQIIIRQLNTQKPPI